MTKPTVFNYKNHEELRQAYKELLADNQQLIADNRTLRKKVAELKLLNDGYVKIIAKNKETNNKLMASVQKQTGGDYINRADAMSKCKNAENELTDEAERKGLRVARFIIGELPSAETHEIRTETHGVCSDLISRADAIEAVRGLSALVDDKDFSYFEDALKEVPSADAQGEWVDWLGNGNEWECSVCKCSVESHGSIAYNYCPMCGARMKGGND